MITLVFFDSNVCDICGARWAEGHPSLYTLAMGPDFYSFTTPAHRGFIVGKETVVGFDRLEFDRVEEGGTLLG